MYYLLGLLVAAFLVLLIPFPFGLILGLGLVLGSVWSASGKRSEGGPDEYDGDVSAAEAERRRLQRIIDKHEREKN